MLGVITVSSDARAIIAAPKKTRRKSKHCNIPSFRQVCDFCARASFRACAEFGARVSDQLIAVVLRIVVLISKTWIAFAADEEMEQLEDKDFAVAPVKYECK